MAEKSEEAAPTSAVKEQISKTEAVRRSLKKLGKNALPKAITADIKERFGLDVDPDYAGKIKATVLAAAKKPVTGQVKKVPTKQLKATPPGAPKPAAAVPNGKSKAIVLDDILTLKSLVDRVGADQLETLIKVMAK